MTTPTPTSTAVPAQPEALRLADALDDGAIAFPDEISAELRRQHAQVAALTAQPDPLKDHQIAALVNELRDIALQYHGTQQLRERIAQVVVPALRGGASQGAAERAVPAEHETVIQDLLDHIEAETCTHESTHRGGAIWEICDDCGAKWADDRGGKPEFRWPAAVERGREFLLAASPAQPAPHGQAPAGAAPGCPDCGTHEVSIHRVCHNSTCSKYGAEVTVHEGWKPAPAQDGEPDPADIIAGSLQTSRAHAFELMCAAVDADRAARAPGPAATADALGAARWRWLRAQAIWDNEGGHSVWELRVSSSTAGMSAEDFDRDVDAALAAQQKDTP